MGEWGNEFVPLPHCVGSHAVDKKQSRLGLLVGFGNPAMHNRPVAEIGGCRFEAGVGEGIAEASVPPSSEAEKLTHCFLFFFFLLELETCLRADCFQKLNTVDWKMEGSGADEVTYGGLELGVESCSDVVTESERQFEMAGPLPNDTAS